ncbi:hypothetical protein Tcan_13782 [Toxocara canis]|uniref:BAR domain-containing protein n=1 Tax=Toxocara canis TaxID=6265 RepID=A0A0B2VUK6_TOXCA|nr:hypothetical protein Tcan_13782 [Toxocara canis]
MLCRVVVSMKSVLQPNPQLVPAAESTMNVECEQGKHPYELLAKTLEEVKAHFAEHMPSLETSIETCRNLATMDHECQRKGRRAMHFMRTFINVDCFELTEQKQALIACRQEMDFAKYSYATNASESNKLSYDAALSRFNQQSDKATEGMSKNAHEWISSHSLALSDPEAGVAREGDA